MGGDRRAAFEQNYFKNVMDLNGDGSVSKSEFGLLMEKLFGPSS